MDSGDGKPPMTFAPGAISKETLASMGPPTAPPAAVPWKNAIEAAYSPRMAQAFDAPQSSAAPVPIAPGVIDAASTPKMGEALAGASPIDQAEKAISPAPTKTEPTPEEKAFNTKSEVATTTLSSGLSNPFGKAFAQQDKALTEKKEAAGQIATVEQAKADAEYGARANLNTQLDDFEKKKQLERDMIANDTAKAQTAYTNAVNDAAKMKVDPEHYWASKSGGQKFALGLAAALGTFGQALSGKENPALVVIKHGIEQDLSLQKDAILNAKDNASLKNNLVSQMMAKGLKFEQAVIAARQVMLDGAKRQIETISAEHKSPEIEANKKMVLAGIDSEIGQATQNHQTLLQQLAVLRAQNLAKVDDPSMVVLPGGRKIHITTGPKEAEELRSGAQALGEMNEAVARIRQLVKENFGHSIAGEAKAEIAALRGNLKLAFIASKGINRITEPELEVAEKQWSDPTSFFSTDGKAMSTLEQFQQRTTAGFIRKLHANGVDLMGKK